MKKIFALMLVGSIALTGCDLFGSDEDGETEAGFSIAPVSATETEVMSGVVYNLSGPKQGAFDLVAGEGVSESEADATKDLLDVTVRNEDDSFSPVDFPKALTSGNGAGFIVDMDVTLETAGNVVADSVVAIMAPAIELAELTAKYADESTEPTEADAARMEELIPAALTVEERFLAATEELEVGDVIVVMLEREDSDNADLAVLEITAVEGDTDADDNSGKIMFDYKVIDVDESTLPALLQEEE